jgi:hypothetical protein
VASGFSRKIFRLKAEATGHDWFVGSAFSVRGSAATEIEVGR